MRKHLARVPVVGPKLIDFVRGLRDPHTERAVAADFAATQRDLAWLRDAMPDPTPAAPGLLVVSLSDAVYQLKLEGMLSAGLRLAGWRPVVLTNSRTNTRALRYFRAFGITDFLYLEDLAPTEEERAVAQADATQLLAGDLSFQAVKAWRYEDSWIGPQILSTVSRTRYEGAPDPADPATRAEIERVLVETLLRVKIAGRLVAQAKPELGLVIEANYAVNGPVVDRLIAAGIAVVQVVQPWRDDALTFKRLTAETRRMHPSSISPATFETLLRTPWGEADEAALDQLFADRYSGKWFLQARNQPGARPADDGAIRARLDIAPGRKTATVFSHILWDANLFYGEDLFADYGVWFVETVRAACANDQLDWLIKLHPANIWKRAREGVEGEFSELRLLRERLPPLPPHVKILPPDSDLSTASLFAFTDFGVTVRGTSGMELPCFGKPTLTAGTGRYSGLGFTLDSRSAGEYLDRLAALHTLPAMSPEAVTRARRHAHAAFLLRPWQMKSFRSVFNYRDRGTDPLDHNLVTVARSLAEARDNGDLERWARWAAGAQVDYLHAA